MIYTRILVPLFFFFWQSWMWQYLSICDFSKKLEVSNTATRSPNSEFWMHWHLLIFTGRTVMILCAYLLWAISLLYLVLIESSSWSKLIDWSFVQSYTPFHSSNLDVAMAWQILAGGTKKTSPLSHCNNVSLFVMRTLAFFLFDLVENFFFFSITILYFLFTILFIYKLWKTDANELYSRCFWWGRSVFGAIWEVPVLDSPQLE